MIIQIIFNKWTQLNSVIHVQPIAVDANETQTIQPVNPIFSAFSKRILIDQITVMLTGDNDSTIDMTGGTGINTELFSVTLILQDIKG